MNSLRIITVLLSFAFFGCEQDFQRVTVELKLQLSHTMQFRELNASGIAVTIKHQQKNISATSYSNSKGVVTFPNLDPGFYTLSASHSVSADTAGYVSGLSYSEPLAFNASKNIALLQSATDTLFFAPAFKSNLIIREFYYAGAATPAGKSFFADQYIEIFNNSAIPQKICGLLIVQHESSGNGFNIWTHIEDSVVVDLIWQIPYEETDVMLAPGKAIVIARDAIDHKDDPNGNPNSPVNLSKADYEFYVEGNNNEDIDAPAKNLDEILTTYRGTDITFHTRNGGGLLLVQPQTDDMHSYLLNHRVKKYSATGQTFRYLGVLPNNWVLDAVDVLRNENYIAFKRFPDNLDAGFAYNSVNNSGTCISRRLVSEVDGREVYMDTNNSTVDFLINQLPNPKLND